MGSDVMEINDAYSGSVTPGGTPQRRTISGATITKISVGPMDNNAYLVVSTATGQSLLIDAANDSERLTKLVDDHAPLLALIVTTHQHGDHWQALADIAGGTGSPTAAHSLDAAALPVKPDRVLDDGDSFTVGDLTFDVIHLRGHTVGSVALALTVDGLTHLFTGDSLFPGGPGKTGNPADFTTLMDDLEHRVFDRFGDATIVYPGHGADTTLGAERPHLAEWRTRGW